MSSTWGLLPLPHLSGEGGEGSLTPHPRQPHPGSFPPQVTSAFYSVAADDRWGRAQRLRPCCAATDLEAPSRPALLAPGQLPGSGLVVGQGQPLSAGLPGSLCPRPPSSHGGIRAIPNRGPALNPPTGPRGSLPRRQCRHLGLENSLWWKRAVLGIRGCLASCLASRTRC